MTGTLGAISPRIPVARSGFIFAPAVWWVLAFKRSINLNDPRNRIPTKTSSPSVPPAITSSLSTHPHLLGQRFRNREAGLVEALFNCVRSSDEGERRWYRKELRYNLTILYFLVEVLSAMARMQKGQCWEWTNELSCLVTGLLICWEIVVCWDSWQSLTLGLSCVQAGHYG
ncbi:hypothetical protein L873DRAFT_817328 [Choiromyces venosus 120613-1]|uniref:Uncharacterized protein n=1 Tax=Choiromyces venosus 120613-1 TaxID=1336337 RepID=A0A3N4JTW5_9PEZI|nr:hypothetical protein L873DRAFT_817328 [Choiromyces venosus 120613-1]